MARANHAGHASKNRGYRYPRSYLVWHDTAGLVMAIVRKDMYAKQKKLPSKLWSFKDEAENKPMINTPPTFSIYILLEVFRWLERQGGLAAMEKINVAGNATGGERRAPVP